jgi:biofilm PGA synthesis N-glycosyltransferase PgaC
MRVRVSDYSVGGTDDVVRSYAENHSFVRLCRNDEPADRNTAAKVNAINRGIEALGQTDYAYNGNLDADVSFGESYFQTLIERFERDAKLGVIGGRIFQIGTRGRARVARARPESVVGAVQFLPQEWFAQMEVPTLSRRYGRWEG